jgi:hypothetical protein
MRWFVALCAAVSALPAFAAEPGKPTSGQVEFFETKVRPVLAEHCYSCHGEKKQSAGLRLDTPAGLKAGADNGPVVAPGDPAKSRLVKSVRREGDYPMPPKKPLPPEAVAALGEALEEAGLTATNEIYEGAAHGYTMADTSMYDEASAERHFSVLRGLLDRTL